MKIYDKAKWHIDGNMAQDIVVKHFNFIFQWLNAHNMLNENGKEEIEIGIDDEISLTSNMLTNDGISFLDRYYDKLLQDGNYNLEKSKKLIEMYYNNI